jgi:hypothetical protein
LAKRWIDQCTNEHGTCIGKGLEKPWYPSRLIELKPRFEEQEHLNGQAAGDEQVVRDKEMDRIRLVETKDWKEGDPETDGFYLSLSHCWGKAQIIRLLSENLDKFKQGIDLNSLPRTFRDAIHFGRRLCSKYRPVRYIWIDSLCIIQDDQNDWLSESAQMFQTYRNSYCNLSATAGTDSEKGLYFDRDPSLLWEDEINLNTEGVPGQHPEHIPRIQRCKILDLAFWERSVDDAPVNKRAWVLQERLMSPRVLHFCQDQIAWECCRSVAAECFTDGVPSFELKGGQVLYGARLKGLVPDKDVRLAPEIPVYRAWGSIVERYSKLGLTKPEDKLIALSGIAKMMSRQIREPYVAGMWNKYLAGQLLWRVDPVFENGRFSYLSKRPKDQENVSSHPYDRAPTFSWAAIDAERGITYGEATEQGMLFQVEKVNVPAKTEDKFGLVKAGGYLVLRGVVKRVKMKVLEMYGNTRYGWTLDGREKETYSNVYLDSPSSDWNIFRETSQVYCVPARKDPAKYLICLLMKLETRNGTSKFTRVGITKVPPYDDDGQKAIMSVPSGDETMFPCCEWDAKAKEHIFHLY